MMTMRDMMTMTMTLEVVAVALWIGHLPIVQ